MSADPDYSVGQVLLGLVGRSRVRFFEPEAYAWRSVRSGEDLSRGLAARLDNSWFALFGFSSVRPGVRGRVHGLYVSIRQLPRSRGDVTPVFNGEIRETPSGSVLAGSIGPDPFLRAFMSIWLGFIALFDVLALVSGAPVIFDVVPIAMFAFGTAFLVVLVRSSRRRCTELAIWITARVAEIDGGGS